MAVATRPIGAGGIEAICKLQDDAYRNHWITYAYHDISVRLADITGGDANWFTFGRWSSFTVGENLRIDQPSLAFTRLLENNRMLRLLGPQLTQMQRDMRTRNDGAMPFALAIGNRLVFHEIAYAVVEFLEWYDLTSGGDEASFAAFQQSIKPSPVSDMAQAGDVEQLREGIECYWRASRATDRAVRAQFVLRGNLLLAAYEQWRLDPVITVALDPFATYLVKFAAANPHVDDGLPTMVLRNSGRPWSLRHASPLVQWVVEQYRSFMTRHLFSWEGPIRGPIAPLFLGRGLPDYPGGQPLYPEVLRTLNDPTTEQLVTMFDTSGDRQAGRRATDWANYSDRMNFVVNLFRAEQCDRGLFEDLSPREARIVDLDLRDETLDTLRKRGDKKVDAIVAEFIAKAGPALDERSLVQEMIKAGIDKDDRLERDAKLPPWAKPEVLDRGQEFFRDHGLEIAAALFCGGLPYSYTIGDGARVLTRTAELTTGHVERRVAETGQMLFDLMAKAGGDAGTLVPGTLGSKAACNVRLFHAAVRHMIRADRDMPWDTTQFGEPISQEHLIGTLVVFTVVVLDALDEMGIVTNTPDTLEAREAYLHFWLVVGHLLGIDYRALRSGGLRDDEVPLTLEEMRLVGESIYRRHARTSADGRTLMAALLRTMQRQMPLPGLLRSYPAAMTRRLIGDGPADLLAVPLAGPVRFLFDAVRVPVRAISPRLQGQVLAPIARSFTRHMYQTWIDKYDGERPPWRVPDVAQTWGVHPKPPAEVDVREPVGQPDQTSTTRR